MIFKSRGAENFTKALIRSGHDHAAASFSSLVGENVDCGEFCLRISSNPVEVPRITKGDGLLTLVVTEIMGQLKGKSYLILSDIEGDQIHRLCVGESSRRKSGYLKGELLTELDNILSAAVITEFSNKLDVSIYGDVPRIFSAEMKDIQAMIQDDLNEDFVSDVYITSDTKFILGNHKDCQPQLIWKLAEPFYFLMQQYAQKEYQDC